MHTTRWRYPPAHRTRVYPSSAFHVWPPPNSGLPEFGISCLAEVGNIRLRLAGSVDRMSEANAGGVGGLFLLRAGKSPPTRLASLTALPANGREGKGSRVSQSCACVIRFTNHPAYRRYAVAQGPRWPTPSRCRLDGPDRGERHGTPDP